MCFGMGSQRDRHGVSSSQFNEINGLKGSHDADGGHFSISIHTVVYMSGDSAEDWSSKGVPNSIMLSKPFAPAQLVTAISNLLNSGTPAA